jgi:hypothetical protein
MDPEQVQDDEAIWRFSAKIVRAESSPPSSFR